MKNKIFRCSRIFLLVNRSFAGLVMVRVGAMEKSAKVVRPLRIFDLLRGKMIQKLSPILYLNLTYSAAKKCMFYWKKALIYLIVITFMMLDGD